MLPEDIQSFYQKGFIKIDQSFSPDQAKKMQDLIWSSIEEQFGILRNDRASWSGVHPPIKLQHLRGHHDFNPIGSDQVKDVFDHLLGESQWREPWHWGQFLIAFPTGNAFIVPHEIWHTDFGFESDQCTMEGLLVFSLISDVPPTAGGTLLIEGSHTFVKHFIQMNTPENRSKMKTVRKALYDSHSWFQKLTNPKDATDRIDYFMESPHSVESVDLRVVQISGEAGDVVIAHPWLLHASSPNCTDLVKMMRVHRIHRSVRKTNDGHSA